MYVFTKLCMYLQKTYVFTKLISFQQVLINSMKNTFLSNYECFELGSLPLTTT